MSHRNLCNSILTDIYVCVCVCVCVCDFVCCTVMKKYLPAHALFLPCQKTKSITICDLSSVFRKLVNYVNSALLHQPVFCQFI